MPSAIFDVQTNIPLIHQVVVAQLAAARQGTHSTKGRGEVRGGGAKPWRQKGTGRARHGSRRSPIWTGGGIVHGPKPRKYDQRTPKKMVAAALRGALSDRVRDEALFVLSSIVEGEKPSTKAALAAIASVTDSNKVLVVLDRSEDVAWLSLRNAVNVHALAVDQLNAYDVVVN
ncbi:MAG: 50S ribosomal protein L4, partial [Propionibacteriales bacterium]